MAPGVQAGVTLVPHPVAGPEAISEEGSLGAYAARVLPEVSALIGILARSSVAVGEAPTSPALRSVCVGFDVYLSIAELSADLREREGNKARAEAEQLAKQLASLTARLGNASFTSRAKPEIVAAERQKEREWTEKLAQLREKVATLCG